MALGKFRDKRSTGKAEGEPSSPPPKKSRLLLYIIMGIVVIIILLIAGGAFAFRMGLLPNLPGSLPKENEQEKMIKEPEFMYELPDVVVNFNHKDKRRFLSLKLVLAFDEPKLEQELERRMPEIRDAINQILWVKNDDDIDTLEGKEKLKEEIFDKLNSILNEGKLRAIYFWHLMIQ